MARRSREQWAALIARLEKSKRPAAEFCARRGIKPRVLHWWRWQLRATSERSSSSAPRAESVKLLSVDMVGDVGTARADELAVLVSGVEVRVRVGVDVDDLAALVGRPRRP
jgi:hypothetical protein